jgi:hypothetical protein
MLFSSGWTLDDVLGLTWQQLQVVSQCVVSYKAEQANLIMQVVTGALGGKVKKPASSRTREQPQENTQPKTSSAKKVDVADRLSALGLPVDNV